MFDFLIIVIVVFVMVKIINLFKKVLVLELEKILELMVEEKLFIEICDLLKK